MKILIHVWSLANGGAERVASLWAQGFASKGDRVSVMLGTFRSRTDYDLPENIKVIRQSEVFYILQRILPQKIKNKLFSSKWCDIAYSALPNFIKKWFTSRVLKKESPDVIIVVLPFLFKRIRGALNICKCKIPVIVTDHNAYERPACAPFSSLVYSQKFKDSKEYDFLTVLTEADYLVLKNKMDSDFLKKVYVLPNPLSFKPQKMVPSKEKVILAAGRMNAWHYKGFDLLLKAWAMVEKKFPDWKLKIAGGGDNSFLTKMCSDLGIRDRVELLGFVNIKEQYEKAEVFVLSSRYEGFGMVLTEAMSQGCACIACDYKGRQREIITDDSQGIICPTEDVHAIAESLCKVISYDDYRFMLQKNAIERSKYYELPNIMKRWDEIFEKMNLNKGYV